MRVMGSARLWEKNSDHAVHYPIYLQKYVLTNFVLSMTSEIYLQLKRSRFHFVAQNPLQSDVSILFEQVSAIR